MIVTCEKCSTQFQLDDSRVPKRGVNVRCSRCKHAFRVVPQTEPEAEPVAQTARRAKGDTDTKEITQDIPSDGAWSSPGDSRSGRSRGARAGAEAAAAPAASGAESEESDWRFNDDIRSDFVRGNVEAAEQKPDPPDAPAPARASRLGDEWFGGGSDAPLELDDRPRGGMVEEPAAPPEPARPAAREPDPLADVPALDTPALDTPALDVAPPAKESLSLGTVAPALDEPAFDASFDGDLRGAPQERLPAEERRAPQEPSDELGGDAWDLLAGSSEETGPGETKAETARKPKRRRPSFDLGGLASRVVEWIGHAGTLIGWTAATTLFGYGLYAGLKPLPQAEPLLAPVGGFEVTSLDGRVVENVAQGALWVVTGRVRNAGAAPADLSSLTLELLDARGQPLATERVALHAPLSQLQLREAPAPLAPPRLAGRVGPGEERSFEAVLASLPPEAVAYRLVGGGS